MRPGFLARTVLFLAAAAWALACAAPVAADPPVLQRAPTRTANLGAAPRVTLENGSCWIEAQHLVAPGSGDPADLPPEPLIEVPANGAPVDWTAPSDGCWFLTLLQLRQDEVKDGRAPRFDRVFEADSRCLRFVVVLANPTGKVPQELLDAADLVAAGRLPEARKALESLPAKPDPGPDVRLAAQRCLWIVQWLQQKRDTDLERAIRYRSEGRLAEARNLLRELLAASPTHAEGQSELGAVLLELDDPAGALPALEKSLELEPRADTAFNLAVARFRLRKWDDAWAACDLCLKWSGEGTRLLERAAVLGLRIAKGLDEARPEAYREIARWAAGTDAGKEAAGQLK
ncbi:MAG: hypothetical protein K8T20_18815 [Planctomycetes bacterium]|nr:hypothetical protein [Planctomycetota bacterium]